jgi:(2R)-ethylmalonyl-CoA mutase
VRAAIDSGYLKGQLVRSMTERMARIGSGEQVVVGVNKWTDALPSPLVGGDDGGVFTVDAAAIAEAQAGLAETRRRRDPARVAVALKTLEDVARGGGNLMEPSIECALARVTTGEWAGTLRKVFGEYRAVTGVDGQTLSLDTARLTALRDRIAAFAAARGRRPRLVVGKPGLDGHSNGAEMIAVAARDAGLEVIYAGIRSTPEEIAHTAVQEAVDLVGLSILSGSHIELAGAVTAALAARGAADIPVVVGGIVPAADGAQLRELGVARVLTPGDFKLADVIGGMLDVLADRV